MSTLKPLYAATATVFGTNDLDSLSASATWLAGRESAIIDNSSNRYGDGFLSGRFKANNTAPTAGQIQVWAIPALNGTPDWPDVFDGTGSAETITSADIRNAIGCMVACIPTDASANRVYEFKPILLAQFFGGALPEKFVIFVTHSMVQALNTTAGQGGQCWFRGINAEIVP